MLKLQLNKSYAICKNYNAMQKVIHPSLQLPNHMNKEDHLTQGF
jgi:hypothetical protein